MKAFGVGVRRGVFFLVFLFVSPYLVQLFMSPQAYEFITNIPLPNYSNYFSQVRNDNIPTDGWGPIYENGTFLFGSPYHDGLEVDVTAGAGATIYSPISGAVSCWFDASNDPVLQIENDQYKVLLLHGEYSVCGNGTVNRGDPVGRESNLGNAVIAGSYHTHVEVCEFKDGKCVEVNPIDLGLIGPIVPPEPVGRVFAAETPENRLLRLSRPLVIAPVGQSDYRLSISTYDPALGGTNCDADCTTMASGDKVAWWIGGRNGVYAAACPREWGWQTGTQFVIGDTVFECRDTGGWINCYSPGELDFAIQNAHNGGWLWDQPEIAEESYCWVDLLGNWDIPYGTKIDGWRFN